MAVGPSFAVGAACAPAPACWVSARGRRSSSALRDSPLFAGGGQVMVCARVRDVPRATSVPARAPRPSPLPAAAGDPPRRPRTRPVFRAVLGHRCCGRLLVGSVSGRCRWAWCLSRWSWRLRRTVTFWRVRVCWPRSTASPRHWACRCWDGWRTCAACSCPAASAPLWSSSRWARWPWRVPRACRWPPGARSWQGRDARRWRAACARCGTRCCPTTPPYAPPAPWTLDFSTQEIVYVTGPRSWPSR